MKKLKENIQKMKEEPMRALAFFKQKVISQWCEPMFQSVWSGPLEDCGQYTHTRVLQSLYNGRKVEKVVAFYCRVYIIALWGLAGIFLFRGYKKHHGWELAFLFLIGGILFHIFWEAKSQYVYQYFFTVIPYGAYSLSTGMKSVNEKLSKKCKAKTF